MLKEICNENPEAKAAYDKLTDEQKAKAECAVYMIGRALNGLIPFIETAIKTFRDFSNTFIEMYPNKRVVYLASHGKPRVRKKNRRRIIKWLQAKKYDYDREDE